MGKLGDVLAHPEEWAALARMVVAAKQAQKLPENPQLAFCYDVLNKVSRSFAVVIQQLPNPLRDAICIFYLVLRGLDTVEDDMSIPVEEKLPALLRFHDDIYDRKFTMQCGTGHYKQLMAQFNIVTEVFLSLEQQYQEVIADITKRMGAGMADFIQQEVESVEDYDLYCHYVAGLVGVGLSQLFATSGLESANYAKADGLANQMGLFLQKTNIIRDYLEDIEELPAPRMFWPRDIWGRYASQLEDFKEPANRTAAVQCLNHLVGNALEHLPQCIKFMQGLRDRDVFRFCAIPQIMSIGTLAQLYNNGKVFQGVVKLRRGLTARVFSECEGMQDLLSWFLIYLHELQEKALLQVDKSDPTREEVLDLLSSHIKLCEKELAKLRATAPRIVTTQQRLLDMLLLAATAIWVFYAVGMGPGRGVAWDVAGSVLQLPLGYGGMEKAVAVMLLLAAIQRVVFVKVH